jgi:hypothetical protein
MHWSSAGFLSLRSLPERWIFWSFWMLKIGNLNMRRIYGGGDTPMRPTV